jgi:hypothetical protein
MQTILHMNVYAQPFPTTLRTSTRWCALALVEGGALTILSQAET